MKYPSEIRTIFKFIIFFFGLGVAIFANTLETKLFGGIYMMLSLR